MAKQTAQRSAGQPNQYPDLDEVGKQAAVIVPERL